jgi:hypothetical protein
MPSWRIADKSGLCKFFHIAAWPLHFLLQAQLRARELGFPQGSPCKSQQDLRTGRVICTRYRAYKPRRRNMGKYFIAWLLGVPAGLLVLIYLFMH